jgi:hypothetical protein
MPAGGRPFDSEAVMQGKSPHALLDRTALPPTRTDGQDPQASADTSQEVFPSPRAVLGEAAVIIAAFLLIALTLQALVVWIGA